MTGTDQPENEQIDWAAISQNGIGTGCIRFDTDPETPPAVSISEAVAAGRAVRDLRADIHSHGRKVADALLDALDEALSTEDALPQAAAVELLLRAVELRREKAGEK